MLKSRFVLFASMISITGFIFFSACGPTGSSGEEVRMKSLRSSIFFASPNIDVTLDVDIRQESDLLKVSYTVHNRSGSDIGIFNRLMSVNPDGTLDFSSRNVYVDIENTTLHLKKMVLPIPEGLTMSERPTPYVTRLADQQSFSEEFCLLVPITVNNPLRRAALAGASPNAEIVADKVSRAEKVSFSLGVFKSDPGIQFIRVSPVYPDIYHVWPPGPSVDRQVILSQSVKLQRPILVLEYRKVTSKF